MTDFDAAARTRRTARSWLAGLRVEPRDYQLRIVDKTLDMFAGRYRDAHGQAIGPCQSVLIESPTGSGKTVMGLAIARALQQQRGLSIGWVSMRRNLLAQAARENAQRGFDVDLQCISMFDKDPPAVDMLIVDEAQHDAAMSMANMHCSVRPTLVLGLTATPFRSDRIKLCFDQVIRDAGIAELIQDDYLSRYHHYTIPRYTPESVADFLVQQPERWGKTLVFFHRLVQCQECLERLRGRGLRAELVTAKSNRERQLADFEAGRIDVLLNMAVLTEGFDCPDLQTVFCRPSGKACTIQMGGRVFRKHDSLRFKQIVQCSETRHPFLRTAMADEQYIWTSDAWRALTVNRRINEISDRARRLLAGSEVTLPGLVAAHRPRPLPWDTDG